MTDKSRAIADLRKSYERDELDESASAADPLQQFERWFQQALAAELPEPNAMTVATVGADGRPDARRADQGLRRARHRLVHQPRAARAASWLATRTRRCNSTGSSSNAWCASRVASRRSDAAEPDAYPQSRPLDSRIGAWASPRRAR